MSFSGGKRETKDAWAESGLRKRKKSVLPPPTITKVWFSSRNYKIGHFTSLNFSNVAFSPSSGFEGCCYSNHGLLQQQYFCVSLFQKNSVESLKNHCKLQKNHKIENSFCQTPHEIEFIKLNFVSFNFMWNLIL